MENQVIKYVRNRHGKRVGVLVGVCPHDVVLVGWSLCNTNLDTFSRELGKDVALTRATTGKSKPIPQSLKEEAEDFAGRCRSYFKQAKSKKIAGFS